jgi:hypothetical protein
MEVISVVLLLISVGLIVGPVGAVVIVYRDDLSGLVIPPEIQGAMNGDTSFILNDNVNSINGYGGSSDDPNSILNNFVAPTFVSATVDQASNTFSVKINLTNPLNYDLTLNTFSTEVQTPDGQQLATINIDQPFTIVSGESAIIQVDGTWTQAGENYVLAHQQDPSITIGLANVLVDVNGIKVERSDPFTVTIPISLSGVSFTGQ